MIYKNYNCNSFNVYTIKTDKFKTSHLEVIFRGKVDKNNLQAITFLADILSDSCKEYPGKKQLVIKYEDLYKMSCYASNVRVGNVIDFHFSLEFINPKYINDENYLENVISTLFKVILEPNVLNDEFDLISFNNVKGRIEREIKAFEENPLKQSIKGAFKLMDKDSVTSSDLIGSLDSLCDITPSSLYKTYKNLLKNFSSDIFVIGDLDMDYLVSLLKKYYKNRYLNEEKFVYYVDNKISKRVKKAEVVGNFVQANLVMIFNLDDLSELEKNVTMHVFNYLYGSGGLTSKLYQSIREKNSLCYNLSSMYLKYDRLLVLHVALENENVLKAISLVKKDLKSMQCMDFTDDEFSDAINNLIVSLDMSSDNNISILNNYIFKIYDNLPDISERKIEFKKITKLDVANVAKKIKLNTIYVLKGKGN